MTIVPTFSSPCDLAQRIPDMIASFFQLDIGLGKRFREESATDVIVASLLQMGNGDVVVIMPDEKVTGSDFDITIVDPTGGDAVQFRIQAKRLTAHLGDWEMSSYRELAHPHGTGGQASTLIRSAAHEKITTIPLYAFYNPTAVCEASGGVISGLELASGFAVSRLVRDLVKSKPKRPPLKRIGSLRHLFFPLSTILCQGATSAPNEGLRIPRPQAAKESVERAITERVPWSPFVDAQSALPFAIEGGDGLEGTEDSFEREGEEATPEQSSLPELVRRAIENRSSTPIMRARVKRPKVVLVSGGS